MAPLELKARSIVEGFVSGLHRSSHHGFSIEFDEHRPYNQGDEFRHIDWKAYGKTERFYVRRYSGETNLQATILLDTSSSMYFHHFAGWSKLRYGVHLAAALIHLLHRQRDAFGLVTFDETVRARLPARSSSHHQRLLYDHLEELLSNESESEGRKRRSSLADPVHNLAETLDRRSMVILISDLFENVRGDGELLSALKHLRRSRHEVIVFQLQEHRSERLFDFHDGELHLQDMETGGELRLDPSQLRNAYRHQVEEHSRHIRSVCRENGIDFVEIDTEGPFSTALLAWLNHRKRIR